MTETTLTEEQAKTGTATETGAPDWISKAAAAATSVLVLASTIAGGATAVAGGATRVFLNHPVLASMSVILTLIGVVIAIFSAFFFFPGRSNKQQVRRLRGLSLAMLVLLVGSVLGLTAIVQTTTAANQPLISAVFKPDTSVVEGTVTVEALQSDARMFVEVDGWPENVGNGNHDRLFTAQVGAAQTGAFTLPFTVPVPARAYQELQIAAWTTGAPTDCRADQNDARLGCLLVRMPVAPGDQPDMSLAYEGEGTQREAVLTISGQSRDEGQFMLIVTEGQAGQPQSVRRRELITADQNGSIARTVRVSSGDVNGTLCAVLLRASDASVTPEPAAASCPPAGTNVATWLEDAAASPTAGPTATATTTPTPTPTASPTVTPTASPTP